MKKFQGRGTGSCIGLWNKCLWARCSGREIWWVLGLGPRRLSGLFRSEVQRLGPYGVQSSTLGTKPPLVIGATPQRRAHQDPGDDKEEGALGLRDGVINLQTDGLLFPGNVRVRGAPPRQRPDQRGETTHRLHVCCHNYNYDNPWLIRD